MTLAAPQKPSSDHHHHAVKLLACYYLMLAVLKPPEPAVAVYAIKYMQIRALGIVPSLVSYVAIAVFRGHKDTKSSLFAAILSSFCGLGLNFLFLKGMDMGVMGTALAAVLASCVSCATLWTRLLAKGGWLSIYRLACRVEVRNP